MHQPLILPLDSFIQNVLEKFPDVLGDVLHLSPIHKAKLPQAISDLSEILTYKRKFLSQSYWQAPRFVSAYMWYFLPWNIIRLTQLFSGLKLSTIPSSAQAIDLGSGPLTLPLALWLSQAQWRMKEIQFLCVDTNPYIMKLGLEFFKSLAGQLGEPLKWKFRLLHNTSLKALRSSGSSMVIMAGNMLNEASYQQKGNVMLQIKELISLVHKSLHPEGFAFFVEPGTRLGGMLTSKLRHFALLQRLVSLAPCTHAEICPLFKNTKRGWCHVSFKANSPEWLTKLTRLAKLNKNTLSISFQLFQHKGDNFIDKASKIFKGRVISDTFFIPNKGYACYVCTKYGLGIAYNDTHNILFGASVTCKCSDVTRRDLHSGAVWLEIVS